MGIDLGSKRIGLAISDEGGEIAFPAGILESRGRKKNLAALRAIITEREVGRVVVGLPLHMDGRRGEQADKAARFAQELGQAAGVPVETLDERWTSMEAERLLAAPAERTRGRGGQRGSRRVEHRTQGTVDEMAASIILKTYLEQRANRSARDDLEARGSEPT